MGVKNFETYLKENGIANKHNRGHRFNHLFYAAGVTFYHLNDIRDFLTKWAGPNDLLKSVQFDVEELVYVSGTRALGIIDKVRGAIGKYVAWSIISVTDRQTITCLVLF